MKYCERAGKGRNNVEVKEETGEVMINIEKKEGSNDEWGIFVEIAEVLLLIEAALWTRP